MPRAEDAERLLEEGMLKVPAAVAFSGYSRTKLYELMDAGLLPYVKIGRSRRIPKVALKRLLAAHLTGGWAQPTGGDVA